MTAVHGLKVTLTGIDDIRSPVLWAVTTANFFHEQYVGSGLLSDLEVNITYTSEKITSRTKKKQKMMMMMRRSDRRELETNDLEVTYKQVITYTTTNPSLTLEDVLQMPLMDIAQQDEYIAKLKKLNGYATLTAVSSISLPSDSLTDDVVNSSKPESGGGSSSFPLWAIILIAVVGGGLLLICLVPLVNHCRNDGRDISQTSVQRQPSSGAVPYSDATMALTAGDETFGTMDYDYSKAYAASSNYSLSDAGGTIGSRSRQTAADPMVPSGSIFSDDPTYNDAAYVGGREEIFDIYAPAGKLGVIIDTPNDGAPIVHAVKDSSPIADKIQVGDKLVAVDDQDVRTMTAIQVSKLISKKSVNASRKMTVIRHM
jgi:hypothetical protein